MANLNNILKILPDKPGVYIMKDINSQIIYIGKAKSLKNRVKSYFNKKSDDIKTRNLLKNINDIKYIITPTEIDALLLENNLIKKHKPKYNILLKDGKTYPYIKITTQDDFPKIEVVRKIEKDSNKYFGPYLGGINPRKLIDVINYAYQLRVCNLDLNNNKKAQRECIYYFTDLCSAPCTGRITKEKYNKNVKSAINFLNGDTRYIEQILNNRMKKAAKMEQFELAIKIRDQIKNLELLKQRYVTEFNRLLDLDTITFYEKENNLVLSVLMVRKGKILSHDVKSIKIDNEQIFYNYNSIILEYYRNKIIPEEILINFEDEGVLSEALSKLKKKNIIVNIPKKGAKKKLLDSAMDNAKEYYNKNIDVPNQKSKNMQKSLQEIKEIFSLKNYPKRIECYDISNFLGTDNVASMVVFENAVPKRSHYRKFKIKSFKGADDFRSINEVIKRRLNRYSEKKDDSFKSLPDLILIDGGKGQLNFAKSALNEYSNKIDILSIAKKEELIFSLGIKNPVKIPENKKSIMILKQLRDEAHRFAITFHRSLRNSKIKSSLENIKGVGPAKRKTLIEKFGSIYNIKKASIDQISELNGINKKLAQEIKNELIKGDINES